MTSAALIVTMLCYIMAMGMALPSKVAVSKDLKAESQWHLQAPNHGCVEVSHFVGGSTFRSYACDGAKGMFCDYSTTNSNLNLAFSSIIIIIYLLTDC